MDKVTRRDLLKRKSKGNKIVVLTAYDWSTARLADSAGVDALLVGDSLGMVVQGHDSTLPVTLDDMVYHARCVARARPRALIAVDLPFGACQCGPAKALEASIRLVQEGRAEAVKLEGGGDRVASVQAVVRADIPVWGHLGLTPQSVHSFGGYRVQGKGDAAAAALRDDARRLEDAGASALVLECIPVDLAAQIQEDLSIPTIGIGAGPHCDGQVLVFHDVLGLLTDFTPKFVKRYAETGSTMIQAMRRFVSDVQSGAFPTPEQSYGGKSSTERRGSSEMTAARLRIAHDVGDLRAAVAELRRAGRPVVFVPTMGALHQGHLSLVRAGQALGPVVVSIFVNPTQFGAGEDFEAYPRDVLADRRALATEGVALCFEPGAETMYPPAASTVVTVGHVSEGLCGAFRPGHFRGVATVVTKLFSMVGPDVAVFGAKDAQQCLVIAQLVRDLALPLRLLVVPTVREDDGLALSSRNLRLDPGDREGALGLWRALQAGRGVLEDGQRETAAVERVMHDVLDPWARIDYAEARGLPQLTHPPSLRGRVLLAVAAHVGGVRLIDNLVLQVGDGGVADAPLLEDASLEAVRSDLLRGGWRTP